MAPVILGYWNIRGFAQPIRFLLEYTGMDWEDKLYAAETTPPYSKDVWFKEKFTLGLDFPNLPYYIEGDLKMTQSKAILRRIARQHGLMPGTEAEFVRVDMVEGEITDFNKGWNMLCYNSPNFETAKDVFLAALPEKLGVFSKYFGEGQWVAGDKLTYIDFLVYEVLDQVMTLEPNCLKAYKNLESFHDRFENLEKIAAFRTSSRFIKFPINNPHAKFASASAPGGPV